MHSASGFTSVYCAAAGTIFGTTDVCELGFSYLSFSIYILYSAQYQDNTDLILSIQVYLRILDILAG